jgi:putative SOS response-associated peptidase YedK
MMAKKSPMPVLLGEKDYEPWLSGKAGLELVKPASENVLQKWPVSKRVIVRCPRTIDPCADRSDYAMKPRARWFVA